MALIAIVISSFLVLTACSSIDPGSYVINQLDAVFKAEFDAASEDTGDSIESYQETRDEMLHTFVHYVEDGLGFELSEEQKERLTDALNNLMLAAQYEVVSHERVDGNYEVTLSITPIINIRDLEENLDDEEIEEALFEFLADNGFDMETADYEDLDEIMELMIDFMIEFVAIAMEDVAFGDEEEIIVTVIRDTDANRIYVSDNEFERLIGAIMPVE